MTTNPFPLNILDKVDSPELAAFFEQFGENKYIGAQNVNKMLQALNFLYENIGGETGRTIYNAKEQYTGVIITVPEGFTGTIVNLNAIYNEVLYSISGNEQSITSGVNMHELLLITGSCLIYNTEEAREFDPTEFDPLQFK